MLFVLYFTGSKVLLTSRNERVARPGETYIDFKPECLSDQDSWTLFKSIAMPRKDASGKNSNQCFGMIARHQITYYVVKKKKKKITYYHILIKYYF